MELAIVLIAGTMVLVVAARFSPTFGIASPLLLTLIGIGYSFIPGLPVVEIPPDIILVGILPPLLYAAALNLPLVDFRKNFGTIFSLSVGMVVFVSVVVGFVMTLLIPGMNLATGIAIGAVVSPTDAVAATSIARRLGLPARLVTVLEGESLFNDATALVTLKGAIAAIAGSVTIGSVAFDFAWSVGVSIAIGLFVGFITVQMRRRLTEPIGETVTSLVVPFLAVIPAEEFHASGILAVVIAGLYTGHYSSKYFSARARIMERTNWQTIQFLLENGVFLFMGAELATILADVRRSDSGTLQILLIGGLVAVLLVVLRGVWVLPLMLRLRQRYVLSPTTEDLLRRRARRRLARVKDQERAMRFQTAAVYEIERRKILGRQMVAEGLGLRGGVVLWWAGMRGVVTLAAAQSIPVGTPYRAEIILIAFTVAVLTLLGHGLTLPWVIRTSRVPRADPRADSKSLAALLDQIGQEGVKVLDDPLAIGDVSQPGKRAVVARVRRDTSLRAEAVWERAQHSAGDEAPHSEYRRLRRMVLAGERAALLDATGDGGYPSRVIRMAQTILDVEDSRLSQIAQEDQW